MYVQYLLFAHMSIKNKTDNEEHRIKSHSLFLVVQSAMCNGPVFVQLSFMVLENVYRKETKLWERKKKLNTEKYYALSKKM